MNLPLRVLSSWALVLLVLFSGAAVGAESGGVKVPPKDVFHLFLLVGQSNMAGRGKVTAEDREPHARVLMLSKDNRWVAATDPMHFDKPKVVGVGLGRSFGIQIADSNPNITVGLIPCAVGGSPIASWEPGGYHAQTKTHPYDDTVRRTGLALKHGQLKGILWHQGESDSQPGKAEVYQRKLHALIARFRKEFVAPHVPFIAGQLGQFPERPWSDAKKLVDAAHRNLPRTIPHTAFVSSDQLTHKGDEVHFDARCLRELGRRYAKAYLAVTVGAAAGSGAAGDEPRPTHIGSRRELFVDRTLVDEIKGDALLHLHRPTAQEVALVTDKPWEGNTCAYYTVFQDGDLYRMYYRGSHYDEVNRRSAHPEVACYAESKDGIHWTKPTLGLFEFEGSKENNIVWDGIGTHCFTVFKDDNPKCDPDARYKAIARGRPRGRKGLYVFKSPDGKNWSPIRDNPVIAVGAFDSQNVAFWDPHAKLYREYHRTFVDGVRVIMTGTSDDMVHWTVPILLDYGDAPRQHLYTNAIRNYYRAPHVLLGFPTRYLPNEGNRVEPTFMASRDGRVFHRWLDAIIPEDAPQDRGGNRSNYMAWGVMQLPNNDRELSVYATEAYYTGPDSRIRRFTYRVDGFISLRGEPSGGELITKPITFAGNRLSVNYAVAAGGSVRIELQDSKGKAINGFGLAECDALQGDEIDRTVHWHGKSDVNSLENKLIRIRFAVKDADLYSFRFDG